MNVFSKTKGTSDSLLGQVFGFILKTMIVVAVFTMIFSLTNIF